MRYTLWYSRCNHPINPYFELYTQYKPLEKGDNIDINGIRGIIKPKGIDTVVLDPEYDTGKLHNLIFKNVYYFHGAPEILISPQKWAR